MRYINLRLTYLLTYLQRGRQTWPTKLLLRACIAQQK